MFFKNHSFGFLFCCITIGFGACTTADIEIPESEPIFRLETGLSAIDSTLSLIAGKDNLYMCADYVLENGFAILKGTFALEDGCGDVNQPHFSISIRDDESIDFDPMTSLVPGDLMYYLSGESTIQHLLTGYGNSPVGMFSWHSASGGFFPTETLMISEEEALGGQEFTGIYAVQGLFSASFNKVLVPSVEGDCGLEVMISGGQSQVSLTIGSGNHNFIWNTGLGSNTLIVDSPGIYTAQVIDSVGCIIELIINLQDIGFDGDYSFGFSHDIITTPTLIPDGKLVEIRYRNAEGRLFTSSRLPQLIDPAFTINNVEEYLKNENGLPTKKIDARFSAILLSDDGQDVLVLENAKVVFGVAYVD